MMRWAASSAIVVSLACTAGCGTRDSAGDNAAPIPYAPADSGRSSRNAHGEALPPGHPPLEGPAGGGTLGRDVLRTGPFTREFPEAGLTFAVPAGWMELQPSAMDRGVIDARLAIPAGDTELTLTMSSTGGGIDLNIERWKGQFSGAAADHVVEPIRAAGVEATWVALRGAFTDPFRPARPEHEDWAVLGAAIPREGRSDFYLKLSGPQPAVERIRDEFRRFIETARSR